MIGETGFLFPFRVCAVACPQKYFTLHLKLKFLGFARISTESENFKSSYTKIISRMMKKGTIKRIKQCIRKIYGQNFEIIRSFSPTCFEFLKLLL